jgi:predicted ATPase
MVGPLVYKLRFSEDAEGFVILDEHLAKSGPEADSAASEIYFERSFVKAKFCAEALELPRAQAEAMAIPRSESVLSRFKSPIDPTPITQVGSQFEQIRILREFKTGPASPTRYGISTSAGKQSLMDGADNLALVLNELDFFGVHDRIKSYFQRFCERFEDVKVRVGAGVAQVFLREAGLVEMLSAIRMSDGTLKFLCLLAALFHPKPPPLMCIEEPELGLHPDAQQLVSEALIEASESMQLIVTTHSEALIDSLSDQPEAVLVCERDFENGTQFKRLSTWLPCFLLGNPRSGKAEALQSSLHSDKWHTPQRFRHRDRD